MNGQISVKLTNIKFNEILFRSSSCYTQTEGRVNRPTDGWTEGQTNMTKPVADFLQISLGEWGKWNSIDNSEKRTIWKYPSLLHFHHYCSFIFFQKHSYVYGYAYIYIYVYRICTPIYIYAYINTRPIFKSNILFDLWYAYAFKF
jgi:hypothetical protein